MSYNHIYHNNYQHSYNVDGAQEFNPKCFQVETNINLNSQQVNYPIQQYEAYSPVKMAENSQTLNEPSRRVDGNYQCQIVLGTNENDHFFLNDSSHRFSTTNHAISQSNSPSERTFKYNCDDATTVSDTYDNHNIDELCLELSETITPEILEKIVSLTADDAFQDQNNVVNANLDCGKNFPNTPSIECIGQVSQEFIERNNDCNMLKDLELFERQMIAQPTVNPFPVPVESNGHVIRCAVESQMNMPLQFDSGFTDNKVEITTTSNAYVPVIEQNTPSVQSISSTNSDQHETETESYAQLPSRGLLKPGARPKDPKNEGLFTSDGEKYFFGKKPCAKYDSNGQKNPEYVSKRYANNSSVKKHRKKRAETEKQMNESIKKFSCDIEQVLSQIKGLVTRVKYIPRDAIPDNVVNIIEKYQE